MYTVIPTQITTLAVQYAFGAPLTFEENPGLSKTTLSKLVNWTPTVSKQ